MNNLKALTNEQIDTVLGSVERIEVDGTVINIEVINYSNECEPNEEPKFTGTIVDEYNDGIEYTYDELRNAKSVKLFSTKEVDITEILK